MTGNPFFRGSYAYNVGGNNPSDGGTVGFIASFSDGAQQLVLPDYADMPVQSVLGEAATLDAGNLVVVDPGTYWWEGRANVLHNYGRYVIFGVSVNGGPIIELGRAQCNSNDFVFVITGRRAVELAAGEVLSFHISSDFQWSSFAWHDVEIMAVSPL